MFSFFLKKVSKFELFPPKNDVGSATELNVWVLWSKRARSRSTRYLQISRWLFGADSSIILEFIALRVKARGDGLFVL